MTVADKMFCSHILPACSLITAQLPFWSHTARDQEHNREEFPFKPAITRFKALIWHKRTQKQRDTLIHLLSFAGSDQRQAVGMKRARQSGSSTKWGKMKICHAEEKTRSLDRDFGCSDKGWRQKVKSGAASRVTFILCPQVIWICCLSSADTICLIYAGKGGWGVIRFDGWWSSPLSRVILMLAVLMTAQFNKFAVKRYSAPKHEQICVWILNFWQ